MLNERRQLDIETFFRIIKENPFYNKQPQYLSASDFSKIPILTKKQVAENKDFFSSTDNNSYVAFTSGSTGIPLKIVWDKSDFYNSIACLWRKRKKHDITPLSTYITCHNSTFIKGRFHVDPIILSKNSISFSKIYSTNDRIFEYIKQIELFQPQWIYAQPSFVYQLGLQLQQYRPNLLESFRYIELVGEMISPTIKNNISKLFNKATVVSMYGMQEFNCIMYESNHLLKECEENVYVEILDEKNQPCDIGKEGNIVVTGLKNLKNPLIRYQTGDRGRIIKKGTEYGYEITQGRSNDSFIYNGKEYDGSIFFHVILKFNYTNHDQIIRFQVVQKSEGLFFYIYSPFNTLSLKEIEKQLSSILMEDFLIETSIKVIFVSSFSDFSANISKTKYFINKII